MNGDSKKQQVEEMFDGIAPTYDALNHLLSFGIDRGWRRKVVKMACAHPSVKTDGNESEEFSSHRGLKPSEVRSEMPRILDVATGTGDLAIALARRIPSARITGVDISVNMLAEGRIKVNRSGFSERIALKTGDAEALDFPDGAFDVVTVAFGVRNFGDIPAGLREMQRVLKPGGRCFILEFSEPRPTSFFGMVYRFYFHRVLPCLGRLVSRDAAAYTYLPRSVDDFPAPGRFAEMVREAGFAGVHTKKLTLGVAYIYDAVK